MHHSSVFSTSLDGPCWKKTLENNLMMKYKRMYLVHVYIYLCGRNRSPTGVGGGEAPARPEGGDGDRSRERIHRGRCGHGRAGAKVCPAPTRQTRTRRASRGSWYIGADLALASRCGCGWWCGVLFEGLRAPNRAPPGPCSRVPRRSGVPFGLVILCRSQK